MAVYTLGVWKVKPGREEEFIAAWRDMATRTESDFPGASAMFLRDRDIPSLFVSSGPGDSLLLDGFEPHTMDPVVTIGG